MREYLYILILVLLSIDIKAKEHIPSNIPPEANFNFTQLADFLRYPYEVHHIPTQDGYILTYFRLQAKNTQIKPNLPVVLVQHGLLDSSDSFLLNHEDQAPGFILANQGYDVWFGNNRGNQYSQGHKTFDASDCTSKFWDFTWQDMTLFDLPASFDYIHSVTRQSISYIGHSEGATIMFAALARRDPVVLSYLNKFISLAPAVYVQHSTSPLVKIATALKIGAITREIDYLLHRKKFGFRSHTNIVVSEEICVLWLPMCIERVKLLSDANTKVDNTDRFVITTGHFPSGTSVRNLLYWEQMFGAKEFTMYDYGKFINMKIYDRPVPPSYDLSKIKEDIHIFAGKYDQLVNLVDSSTLRDRLTGANSVTYKSYELGHGSFLWGKDVKTYMDDVLSVLKS